MLTTMLCSTLAMGCAPQVHEFHPPVRLEAGGSAIRVEQPGFACPSLFDVTRDGKPDLVVGQFKDGKMQVFAGLGGGKFGKGEWLMAEGDVAQVPGVW